MNVDPNQLGAILTASFAGGTIAGYLLALYANTHRRHR